MEESKQSGRKPGGRKKGGPKEGVKKNLLEIDGQTIELTERVVSMARVAKGSVSYATSCVRMCLNR